MKTRLRRALAMIALIAFVVTMLPLSAFAEARTSFIRSRIDSRPARPDSGIEIVPHKTENTTEAEKSEDSKSSSERDSLEEECDFCVYDDIKKKLIAKGILESEIAYIHNAKTEKQKTELFDKVRNGEVRVLLGSTAKMGTGTNVQKKLIAVHDLDIPWRPADLERAPVKAAI